VTEPVLLAHAGGAPEAALVVVPIALLVVFGLLERRARRREAQQDGEGSDGSSGS